LAAYYLRAAISRTRRDAALAVVLHASVLTLIVPMFLMLYWIGLLDTLFGVILVLVARAALCDLYHEGLFRRCALGHRDDALTDGASGRQAFLQVVLPHGQERILAISVFTFIRGGRSTSSFSRFSFATPMDDEQ